MQHQDTALSFVVACSLALVLVSVPSYEFLTSEDAYLGALNDEAWLSTLPGELSSEVAGAIGDVLFLSSGNEGALAEYLAGRVTVTWAREQGERAIYAIVAFIKGESDTVDGYVDISIFRQSLLGMLYDMVPPLLVAVLSEYVPAELPLSLILNADGMDGIRGMISLLDFLRMLAIGACAALAGTAVLKKDTIPPMVWARGIGVSGILAIVGVGIVRSRILASFDAASVGFISSYGALFAGDYVRFMVPIIAVATVLAVIGLIVLPLWRGYGTRSP